MKCASCGYTNHVEVCHIKSVSSFSEESTLNEINSLDNCISEKAKENGDQKCFKKWIRQVDGDGVDLGTIYVAIQGFKGEKFTDFEVHVDKENIRMKLAIRNWNDLNIDIAGHGYTVDQIINLSVAREQR